MLTKDEVVNEKVNQMKLKRKVYESVLEQDILPADEAPQEMAAVDDVFVMAEDVDSFH